MYVTPNFRTKKELKEAVKRKEKVVCWQPGPFGKGNILTGTAAVEGPHYPEPHKWYATVWVEEGIVVKVA